jgi:hypothetical protein
MSASNPTEESKGAICSIRVTSIPVVSFAQIPDFAAFPGVDIRAMVGVAKHATRAFLFSSAATPAMRRLGDRPVKV